MAWQYTPYTLPLLLSATTTGGLAFYIWRRRANPGAVPLLVVMLAVVLWTLSYTARLASADPQTQTLWLYVQYAGVVIAPTMWLVFALHYTGRRNWLDRRTGPLLVAGPLLTLILVWTNPQHHLFWAELTARDMGGYILLQTRPGPGFWLHLAYSYLAVGAGSLLLAFSLLRASHLYRPQVAAALLGIAAPWAGNALTVFGITPFPHLDLTPFAFAVMGLAMGWGLFRFRFLDLVPVARDLVVERVTDGILVLDAQGRVADLNPAAGHILGGDRPVGQQATRLLPALAPLLGPGEQTAEIDLGPDGRQRSYEARAIPLSPGAGRTGGWLVELHDITERLRHEEELHRLKEVADRANRAKSDFLARMNHELRTPLSSVIGYADILLEEFFGPLNDKQRESITHIRKSSDQLVDMVNEALDMAKIEAGKVTFHLEDFEIGDVVDEAVDTVRPLLERNGNQLQVDNALGPLSMRSDRLKTRQCLLNLLSNAAKFTQEGAVRLEVRADGEAAVFVVEDTGVGMTAEQIAHIFDAYTQASDETERYYGGTGLGLAITSRFAQLMGGHVEVQSQPHRGSRFTLRLPLEMRPPDETTLADDGVA